MLRRIAGQLLVSAVIGNQENSTFVVSAAAKAFFGEFHCTISALKRDGDCDGTLANRRTGSQSPLAGHFPFRRGTTF